LAGEDALAEGACQSRLPYFDVCRVALGVVFFEGTKVGVEGGETGFGCVLPCRQDFGERWHRRRSLTTRHEGGRGDVIKASVDCSVNISQSLGLNSGIKTI
jgi:hypothetical protein